MVRSALQHTHLFSTRCESHECLSKRQVPTAPTVERGRSSSRDERRRRDDAYTRNVAWGPSALALRRRRQGPRHRNHRPPLRSRFHRPLRGRPRSHRATFGTRHVLNPMTSRIATNAHPIPNPKNTMNTITLACSHRSRGDSNLTGASGTISRSNSDSCFVARLMTCALVRLFTTGTVAAIACTFSGPNPDPGARYRQLSKPADRS